MLVLAMEFSRSRSTAAALSDGAGRGTGGRRPRRVAVAVEGATGPATADPEGSRMRRAGRPGGTGPRAATAVQLRAPPR